MTAQRVRPVMLIVALLNVVMVKSMLLQVKNVMMPVKVLPVT